MDAIISVVKIPLGSTRPILLEMRKTALLVLQTGILKSECCCRENKQSRNLGVLVAKARKISRGVRQIIVSSTGELTPELSLSHRPASSSVTGREDKAMALFLALEVCFPATACFGYAWTNSA